jgi:hypothetical protein
MFSKDHSRTSSSYSVISDVLHLPTRVLSSNTSAITGRVTGVVECGAGDGGGRGSKRPGISLRRELGHSEGRWIIGLTISSVATAPVATLGFYLGPVSCFKSFQVGKPFAAPASRLA